MSDNNEKTSNNQPADVVSRRSDVNNSNQENVVSHPNNRFQNQTVKRNSGNPQQRQPQQRQPQQRQPQQRQPQQRQQNKNNSNISQSQGARISNNAGVRMKPRDSGANIDFKNSQKITLDIASREEVKDDMKNMIRNDLLGAKDFKEGKFSWFLGGKVIGRVGSSFINNLMGGFSRSAGLLGSMIEQNNRHLPSLENVTDAEERFMAALHVYNIGDAEEYQNRALKNTYNGFCLYAGLSFIAFIVWILSFSFYPYESLLASIVRMGPVPILWAMILKFSYTNYIFRHQRMDKFLVYLKSGDYLPKNHR